MGWVSRAGGVFAAVMDDGLRLEARWVGRKLGVASFLVLLEVTAVLLLGGTGNTECRMQNDTEIQFDNTCEGGTLLSVNGMRIPASSPSTPSSSTLASSFLPYPSHRTPRVRYSRQPATTALETLPSPTTASIPAPHTAS